jgi:DNA gyrase/topoisomerase IV subunit B
MTKVSDNDEITNVKKISRPGGREAAHRPDELRYGRVLILADQDVDGRTSRAFC